MDDFRYGYPTALQMQLENRELMMTLKTLRDLEVQEKLKAYIITYARALYGHDHPDRQNFDVLIIRKGYYDSAYLIVYTEPGSFAKWETLFKGRPAYQSEAGAYAKLLESLKWKLGPVVDAMEVADTTDLPEESNEGCIVQ